MTAAVTVHIPRDRARQLIEERGWTRCVQSSARGGELFASYTRPGHPSRAEGGRAGTDYLWELDEALTVALAGPRNATPKEVTR